jgi:plasmid stability protein
MSELVISNVETNVLHLLKQRALTHGHSVEDEARLVLEEALGREPTDTWAEVNAIRERLAATGRTFSDSAELVREDRDR